MSRQGHQAAITGRVANLEFRSGKNPVAPWAADLQELVKADPAPASAESAMRASSTLPELRLLAFFYGQALEINRAWKIRLGARMAIEPDQPLADDSNESGCHNRAIDAKLPQSKEGRNAVGRMNGREHQMAGHRRVKRGVCRVGVANLAYENHVR